MTCRPALSSAFAVTPLADSFVAPRPFHHGCTLPAGSALPLACLATHGQRPVDAKDMR